MAPIGDDPESHHIHHGQEPTIPAIEEDVVLRLIDIVERIEIKTSRRLNYLERRVATLEHDLVDRRTKIDSV